MKETQPIKGTSRSKGMNRRQFLKTTATAGAVLMAPTILPSSVLGRGGAVPPSERIILGGIGIGGALLQIEDGDLERRHRLRPDDAGLVVRGLDDGGD